MKEEADTSRKLPPKILCGIGGTGCHVGTTHTGGFGTLVNNSTSSKHQSDEILSNLLRLNSFDSISSIKDESLDIDLSACVTITTDPSCIIGGNSLSSSDFWRVLDESAQTIHLESVGNSSNGNCRDIQQSSSPSTSQAADSKSELRETLRKQQTDFSGTFLRPEVPSSCVGLSPLKRTVKPLSTDNLVKLDMQQMKDITPSRTSMKLEGIPWLAPVRIQSSEPKITINTSYTKNDNESNLIQNIKKETVSTYKTEKNQSSNILDNGSDVKITDKDTINRETAPSNIAVATLTYKCIDCDGLVFSDINHLINHANHRLHYKCSECGREFESETSLKKHLKTHRNLDSRKDVWKKCPDCGKCLKLGSMWMHRKIHAENKKYGCEICGQKFVQKINLTHHTRIHTAEKPYECSECQKRFQERSHLQRHQKYHAQTRSYRCEKCGKMYKTERCLKVHNLVHLEQRPFACTVCDKSFISNSKLKQHSNIHTGERPFKCNYCPRDFTNFPNWLKHTRRRHKVDHKTGEMLLNIPSYCSKKSNRTTKEKKTSEMATNSKITPMSNTTISTTVTTMTVTTTTAGTTTIQIIKNNQSISQRANIKADIIKSENKSEITTTKPTYLTVNLVPLTLVSMPTSMTTSTASKAVITPSHLRTPLTSSMAIKSSVTISTIKDSSLNVVNLTRIPPLVKMPTKRRKKLTSIEKKDPSGITDQQKQSQELRQHHEAAVLHNTTMNFPLNGGPPPLSLVYGSKHFTLDSPSLSQINSISVAPMVPKIEKTKRERKQSTPKQVQKVPALLSPQLPVIIKKEFIEPNTVELKVSNLPYQTQQQTQQIQSQSSNQSLHQTKANFADLHCLSITSAEELIMEQALEMEECGLLKTTTSMNSEVVHNFGDTDNAISSESMADLHFKIKQEHEFKPDDNEQFKKTLCSSLESSPFSSPASLDFTPSSSTLTSKCADFSSNNFYLPTFTIHNAALEEVTIPTTTSKLEHIINPNMVNSITTELPQLIETNITVPEIIQVNNTDTDRVDGAVQVNGDTDCVSAKQTLINQLYLPITMNSHGPAVIMKSTQALPSVDTLLFSHSKLGIFNGHTKQMAATAENNLT